MRRLSARATALALAAVLSWLTLASPASALTTNEKFTYAVYEDFLFREPSVDEVTWWTAYLGSGSRTAMVTSLLNTSEFKNLWVIGASQHYTGGTDSQYTTIKSSLASTGDFVASEVTLLSGPDYFANSGSTNTGYVTSLYQDVLLRNGSSGDITYWAGQITNGTRTRSWVANYFIRTTESASRRVAGASGLTACPATVLTDLSGISSGSYCIVLDRLPGSTETSYWAGRLASTDQLPWLWAAIAGSSEYLTNAQARF